MKPLELNWHLPFQDRQGNDWYVWGDTCVRPYLVDEYSGMKRLRDTELAAEMFRQAAWLGAIKRTYATDEGRNVVIEAAFTFGPITRDEHEWLTVNRFATLPHYDEAT